MDKDKGRASSTADDTLTCTKITEALANPALVAAIADRVAAAINSRKGDGSARGANTSTGSKTR